MSTANDVLARVIGLLERARIPYMVAGSFASTYYSVPRTTNDIDLIIDPTGASLDELLAQLPADTYYVDPETARDALRTRGQFNVIDMVTGWKIDFIIRKHRPFSVEEFRRRSSGTMFGVVVLLASAEDTVVAKLEWAKLGSSERQLRDVREILDVRGRALDRAYIEHWVAELELHDEWARVNADDRV